MYVYENPKMLAGDGSIEVLYEGAVNVDARVGGIALTVANWNGRRVVILTPSQARELSHRLSQFADLQDEA